MTTYNKLVRDKIPTIIKKKGGVPVTHIANDREYWQKLKEKFHEEVQEFLKDGSAEELADVLEVIDAVCAYRKFNKRKLETLKIKKRKERGGFTKRIILKEA